MAVDESFESAAGFDGAELVVVTDDYCLGTGDIDGGEELEDGLVVSHSCFIDQEHRLLVERERSVLQVPHK